MLLPHLADRPLTVKRYPNGVDKPFFFEKNAARGTPSWVRTVTLPVPGSTMNRDTIDYVVVEELADAGVAGQPGRARAARAAVATAAAGPQARAPTSIVFDLDPGPPATIVECCEVALLAARAGSPKTA